MTWRILVECAGTFRPRPIVAPSEPAVRTVVRTGGSIVLERLLRDGMPYTEKISLGSH